MRRSVRGVLRRGRWRLLAIALLAPGLHAAAAAAEADAAAEPLLDRVLRQAEADHARAAELLAREATTTPGATPAQRREQALLRAWLAALQGRLDAEALGALDSPGPAADPRLAEADRQLLRALQAEHQGRADSEDLARQALAGYEAHCGTQAPLQPDCEYRLRWQARLLLAQRASGRHAAPQAREQALAALDLATAGRDTRRQAWSEAELAIGGALAGDQPRAERHLARAQAAAARRPQAAAAADTTLQLRLALAEAYLAQARQDRPSTLAALQRG